MHPYTCTSKVNRAASTEDGQRPLHLVLVETGEKSEVSLLCLATYTSVFALDGGWVTSNYCFGKPSDIAIAVFTTCIDFKAFHILHTRGIYVFCMVLIRNSNYLPLQNYYMAGFHTRGGVCLLRGTERNFEHFTD